MIDMHPVAFIIREMLRSKVLTLILTVSGGLLIEESLPFLAHMLKIKPKPTVSMTTITRARKEKDALIPVVDSLTKRIEKHPTKETVYRTINEKVYNVTHNATNAQLDSILTNYKYEPFTKKGDSERFDRFR